MILTAKLIKVIDGDTVCVSIELPLNITKLETIRLLDINAPERNTPEGKDATEYLSKLITNELFLVDIGNNVAGKRDKYGRLLAHLYIIPSPSVISDGKPVNVSSKLLQSGLVTPYK